MRRFMLCHVYDKLIANMLLLMSFNKTRKELQS